MRALLPILLLAAAPRLASAEINMADTIEWVTADSDAVVVGKVGDVRMHRAAGEVAWFDASLTVSETIKGPTRKSLPLTVRLLTGDAPAPAWLARGTELLVFAVDTKRLVNEDKEYLNQPFAPRHGGNEPDVYALAAPRHTFTTAFDVLAKRDALLAAVRAAAGSTAKQSYRIDAPLDSPAGKELWSGSSVWLYVPIDAKLESLAVSWLAGKNQDLREAGVGALSYFKSAENTKRLQALLKDKQFSTQNDRKHYAVRAKAHEILTAWGIRHATPVIDE
jgi:hypothetical protein